MIRNKELEAATKKLQLESVNTLEEWYVTFFESKGDFLNSGVNPLEEWYVTPSVLLNASVEERCQSLRRMIRNMNFQLRKEERDNDRVNPLEEWYVTRQA